MDTVLLCHFPILAMFHFRDTFLSEAGKKFYVYVY